MSLTLSVNVGSSEDNGKSEDQLGVHFERYCYKDNNEEKIMNFDIFNLLLYTK